MPQVEAYGVSSQAQVYDASLPGWVALRTPTLVKSGVASGAGDTPIWTPPAGKRFRLMGFMLTLRADAILAVAGLVTIALRDAGNGIGASVSISVPAVAVAGILGHVALTPWVDLGNGVLSAGAGNPLNLNLSAALAAGVIGALVTGTEE